MKYRMLIEGEQTRALTHEVLTSHLKHMNSEGRDLYWHSMDGHGPQVPRLEDDIRSVGWEHHRNFGEGDHTTTQVFRHPDHHEELHVERSHYDEDPDAENGEDPIPYSHLLAYYKPRS